MIRSIRQGIYAAALALLATAVAAENGGVTIRGKAVDAAGKPVSGVSITARDAKESKSVSVYTQTDGTFAFPSLPKRNYKLRARQAGLEDERQSLAEADAGSKEITFTMKPAKHPELQMVGAERIQFLNFDTPEAKLNFRMMCIYCHQVGTEGFRAPETEVDFDFMLRNVMAGPVGQGSFRALHKNTQDKLAKMLFDAFGQGNEGNWPKYEPPPAPCNDQIKVEYTEWDMGVEDNGMIHDLEFGKDGLVYVVDMIQDCMRTLDPKTGERHNYPIPGGKTPDSDEMPIVGPHSIEVTPDGDMWITLAMGGKMGKFDPKTKEWTIVPSAANGRRGGYPHTLRCLPDGTVWYTDAALNSVFRLDTKTMEIKQYRLTASGEGGGPTIGERGPSTPYGIDVAPDGKIWYTKLNGHKVGVIDPVTDEIKEMRPPIDGPRRHEVDKNGTVWVPGYGSGNFASYTPAKDEWKIFPLPYGGNDIPYALNVNPKTQDVWICLASSDSIYRYTPSTDTGVQFRFPSHVTYTREVEFDSDGNAWVCNSNFPVRHIEDHFGSIIRIKMLN